MVFGHSLLAYQATTKGLSKLNINTDKLQEELDDNWEVLAEAIQTVMRRYGIEQPYEKLKTLTRGQRVNQAKLADFIETLTLPKDVKLRLSRMTPSDYIGLAAQLAKQ